MICRRSENRCRKRSPILIPDSYAPKRPHGPSRLEVFRAFPKGRRGTAREILQKPKLQLRCSLAFRRKSPAVRSLIEKQACSPANVEGVSGQRPGTLLMEESGLDPGVPNWSNFSIARTCAAMPGAVCTAMQNLGSRICGRYAACMWPIFPIRSRKHPAGFKKGSASMILGMKLVYLHRRAR